DSSLSGSGTLTGGKTFQTDNITISGIDDLVYDGTNQMEKINLAETVTICGKEFNVNKEKWEKSIVPPEVKMPGDYTVTFTMKDNETQTVTKTFNVAECPHTVLMYKPLANGKHGGTCSLCNTEVSEEHNLTHTERKEPTCTENGNNEYWKCDDCGTYFSDENSEKETTLDDTVIPARGHDYSDGKCTVCGTFEDGIGAHLAGHSISLDGNIGVNFYMELDKSVIADKDAYMQFTLPNGNIQAVNVSQAKKSEVNGKQYYVFPCKVAAKEMFDTIKAQIISGDNVGTVYEYSVMEYADCILLNPDNYDDKTVKLVREMLYYGQTADLYFSSSIIKSDSGLDKVTADNLTEFEKQISGELPDGIEYYGSSLLLESNTTVRHYFKAAKGTAVIAYDFSGYKDGYYYTDITGIPAGMLGTPQEKKIGDWSISYSPMSYVYSVLNSDSTDKNLVNLCKALYLYQQAAEAYQQR
ncbi:MAG: hypothetical protein K2H19_05255, partial [Ruminococcus sp.]|nr:hypothetical protein [Ruminococcus sp.]